MDYFHILCSESLSPHYFKLKFTLKVQPIVNRKTYYNCEQLIECLKWAWRKFTLKTTFKRLTSRRRSQIAHLNVVSVNASLFSKEPLSNSSLFSNLRCRGIKKWVVHHILRARGRRIFPYNACVSFLLASGYFVALVIQSNFDFNALANDDGLGVMMMMLDEAASNF